MSPPACVQKGGATSKSGVVVGDCGPLGERPDRPNPCDLPTSTLHPHSLAGRLSRPLGTTPPDPPSLFSTAAGVLKIETNPKAREGTSFFERIRPRKSSPLCGRATGRGVRGHSATKTVPLGTPHPARAPVLPPHPPFSQTPFSFFFGRILEITIFTSRKLVADLRNHAPLISPDV